jgi:sugar transferase (PEP-CTERM/EpsH1 system associated)
MLQQHQQPPLFHVVHMVYRFAAGGLENVIVQLINGLPRDRYRHTVLALTSIDQEFIRRVQRPDVQFIALDKPPGQPFRIYPRVYRLLQRLRPDVLHTCNIAALEFMPVAALVGVPLKVHAEHGWDVADPDGRNRKYQLLRKVYQRFVDRFVVVSEQLETYLVDRVGIARSRVQFISNGVDTTLFRPRTEQEPRPDGYPFQHGDHWVIGTVGRLEPIKHQLLLARAFVRLVQSSPAGGERLRLAIVGAGPLLPSIAAVLDDAGLSGRVWMPGVRSDVALLLRQFDVFVLPSLAEGTSCTLQEAMATGLPIIATEVGGNSKLLDDGGCGQLVPSDDVAALASALTVQFLTPSVGEALGGRAREHALMCHSVERCLQAYEELFNPEMGKR